MAILDAIVVGAGFSGLCAGVQLREAGFHDFLILEKADRVGGTWRENTYPGAACDVPSHLYSYSFAPNPRWSRAYGEQAEILDYLERCADKFGLRPHLRFNHTVREARFDEIGGVWHVHTDRGDFTARALMLGNGALHIPQLPNVPGLDRFTGTKFHSARWNHDYDFKGKRVAVIGTGASSIQFVPRIAREVDKLHVFQRTPPWIVPKRDRKIGARERWALEHVPGAHALRRTALYWSMESRVIGFAYAPSVLAFAEKLVKRYIAGQVPDPALRAKLTPNYRLGCKRVLISNEYYPAIQRPNVELVTEGIAEVTATGVRTIDGVERPVDAIVCGTGFRVSEYLSSIQIVGRGGVELNETWRTSLRNYLGITVSGFPNLFLLMGPNTGLGHNSMIFMIEAQARYAVQALSAMRRDRIAFVDVRPEVEAKFRDQLAAKMKGTVWMTGCQSWYQTANGEVFLWPAATVDYWWRTRTVALSDYDTRALTASRRQLDAA
ncbi:MAG TPA: NAD(P)/FAD-dependent oxidoreductase [Kofleriaceae bacterium]|nr:NAD(P)/FAD-dependent oxidoreductase [Kofleriaceae bacterium]